MSKRFTLDIPDELLKKIDQARNEAGISRAEFLREAARAYLTLIDMQKEKYDLSYVDPKDPDKSKKVRFISSCLS